MDSVREEDLPRLLASDLVRYFPSLLDVYKDRLATWTVGLVGKYIGDVTAEDILMETFEKAYWWLAKSSAEEIECMHLWPWLRSIARNNFMNYLRKPRVKTESMDTPERCGLCEEIRDEYGEEPEAIIVRDETYEKLHDLLEALPLKYREAVELKHLKEFTYPEVAEILNIPLSDAKGQVSYGMKLLRKMGLGQEYWCETR